MAYEQANQFIDVPAGSDLSAKEFYFVNVNSSGQLALSAAGVRAIGVLYSTPNAQGEVGRVACCGVVKVIAGATITAGDDIASDANGKAGAVTTGRVNTSDGGAANDPLIGSEILGIALASAVSGDVFSVYFCPRGAVPQTVQ